MRGYISQEKIFTKASTHVLYEIFARIYFRQYSKGRRSLYVIINTQGKICGIQFSPTEATGKIGENFILAKNTHCTVSQLLYLCLGQECLHSNSKNGVPPVQSHGRNSCRIISPGFQAIIPSYQFQCYGNITQWMVANRCTSKCSIDIELQVWRPSVPVNNSRQFYSKVGVNRFTTVSRIASLIPQTQIEVIPGDVLGLKVLNPGEFDRKRVSNESEDDVECNDRTNRGGSGIVILRYINNTETNEVVWYARVSDAEVNNRSISVGSHGTLNTSTNAAPLISVIIYSTHVYTSTQSYHTIIQNTKSLYNTGIYDGVSATVSPSTGMSLIMTNKESSMKLTHVYTSTQSYHTIIQNTKSLYNTGTYDGVNATVSPSTGMSLITTNKESSVNLIVVIANTAVAVLVTVSITIIVMVCICLVVKRRIKMPTLTRASRDEVQQDKRNTPFYSEDAVEKVRDRQATRIQGTQAVAQYTEEIGIRQQNDAISVASRLDPGPSGFGNNEIELSNVDSIVMMSNEAYERFTESGDYENDYTFTESGDYENEYYGYDYIYSN